MFPVAIFLFAVRALHLNNNEFSLVVRSGQKAGLLSQLLAEVLLVLHH